ncbi:3-hydroxyacyl-CoA dehydrogenase [Strigomonas culicis]|uniref:3-hydroxyacyl-CoA dehydrogenase n=1 Tax=Strigomonas culicis TaxID=28005 RepID=S9UZ41_9TRYP|nr:3-hydroxyacyl-CoA dehydrogenase [Strigomonas culicis]|eukprot:EPY15820.1 3-hydroxyacyl-CoA dehydrogenase [Strigomonas culicis]
MSRAVEEAIEDAQRTRVLRPFQPPQEPPEAPVAAAVPMDFSSHHDHLQPLPADLAESLDRHEVPVALGGEHPVAEAADAPATTGDAAAQAQAADADAGAGAAAAAVRCQPPVAVWEAQLRPYADNSVSCVKVIAERGVRRLADTIVIQLVETPSTALSAVRALSLALDDVAALIAKHTPAAAAPPRVHTVELRTAPSCDFFVAAQSPLELGLGERLAYQRAKEVVLARLRHPSPPVRFTAFAQNRVTDFGAEVFFACGRRCLVADPTVAAGGDPVVGFPSLAMGVWPAASTVDAARRQHGAQFAVDVLPRLHRCDALSLRDAGLLDGVVDLTGREVSAAADEGPAAAPAARPSWSARLEELLLRRVCPTPEWRARVLRCALLSRDVCARVQGGGPPGDLMRQWYAYAWQVLTHADPASMMLECDDLTEALVRSEASQGQARHVRHLRRIARRALAPLVNTSFVSLKDGESEHWVDALQRLASPTAPGGYAGTLLLDCSAHGVERTLRFVASHLRAAASASPQLHLVLLGGADSAARVLPQLPCAALVSSASPVLDWADFNRTSSLQTVQVFSRAGWPADLCQDTLLAAVTYLQHRGLPYVVSAPDGAQRLVAALSREALALVRGSAAAADVEAAATRHLHLRHGPLRLMDLYGTRAVLLMLAAAPARPARTVDDTAVALDGLERMLQDGRPGLRRPGFYASAAATEAEQAVVDQYFRAALPSVADRLLAVLVNECCALLDEGAVLTPDDVNALAVTALVMEESSGGVLGLVDRRPGGVAEFARSMHMLAARHGAHLAPHPLLTRIAEAEQSFANVTDAVLRPPQA